MHTEHLQNVRAVRVLVGWLVAIAVTSLVALVFAAMELLHPEAVGGTVWAAIAVVVGFFVGGAFTGLRALAAPILHGVAIGLTSLVAWLVLNLAVAGFFEVIRLPALTAPATLAFVLVQMLAAVLGARAGYVFALRGAADTDLESLGS